VGPRRNLQVEIDDEGRGRSVSMRGAFPPGGIGPAAVLVLGGDGRCFRRFKEMKPLFVAALETGLRSADLLGLRWSSVDLSRGWIRVTVEKTRRDAVIPISEARREALLECRRRSLG
jgi:hypothetical protein